MQNNYQGTTMNKTTQDYKGNFYDDVTKKLYKWSRFKQILKARNEGDKKDGAKK